MYTVHLTDTKTLQKQCIQNDKENYTCNLKSIEI